MLPDDAFLRRMPRSLDLAERLRLEAIVTACDIIEYSFKKLTAVLETVSGPASDGSHRALKIEAAIYSWSLIDQLHNFRQLTKKLAHDGGRLNQLNDKIGSTATEMRNKMDHLKEGLGNLARKKGASHPLHGALSFATKLAENGWFEYLFFSLGDYHHGEQYSAIVDTHMPPPSEAVGNINFAAFGYQANLSEIVSEVRGAIEELNEHLSQYVVNAVAELAKREGLDADQLHKDIVSGAVVARMSLRPR